jgi:hypothetical protein
MINGYYYLLWDYDIGEASTDWKVIGTGDFNNDGHGDILWRNNSGQLAIWEMAGTGLKNSPPTTTVPKLPGLAEKPFVADFNGDGISDLLWQGRSLRPASDPLSSSGYTYLSQTWTMAAGTTTPASTQSTSSISTWTAAGGQFGGDGGIDQFLRSPDGGTFFAMSVYVGPSLPAIPVVLPGPKVAAEWEVKAVGDFNGDGTSDLLWQNRNNGTVSIWEVQNGTYVTSHSPPMSPSAEWQVLGAADMDGDGVSDIVWRNNNDGQVSVWLMSNYGIKDSKGFMITTEWEFAGILSTKTRLGGFQAGTQHYVKSASLCSGQTFTITGPKPETISRSFNTLANFDYTNSLCSNWMDEFFVNIAGDYRLEAGDLGGFDFTVKAGAEDSYSRCPDKAICSKPTGPTPPPPPPPPAANLTITFVFDWLPTLPSSQDFNFTGNLDTAKDPKGAGNSTFSQTVTKPIDPCSFCTRSVSTTISNLKQGSWTVTGMDQGLGISSKTCSSIRVGGSVTISISGPGSCK